MTVFIICTCVWACIATLASAWAVGKISDNRRIMSIARTNALVLEAKSASEDAL